MIVLLDFKCSQQPSFGLIPIINYFIYFPGLVCTATSRCRFAADGTAATWRIARKETISTNSNLPHRPKSSLPHYPKSIPPKRPKTSLRLRSNAARRVLANLVRTSTPASCRRWTSWADWSAEIAETTSPRSAGGTRSTFSTAAATTSEIVRFVLFYFERHVFGIVFSKAKLFTTYIRYLKMITI